MGAHVASHAVLVPDLGAALKYYSDVLGFSIAAYFGDHAVLVRPDVGLRLQIDFTPRSSLFSQ